MVRLLLRIAFAYHRRLAVFDAITMWVPAKHMLWRLLRLVYAFACDLGNRLLRRNGHPNIAGLTEIKTNSAEHRSWGSTNFSALSCPQRRAAKSWQHAGAYLQETSAAFGHIDLEVTRHMLLCAAIFLGALADDRHRIASDSAAMVSSVYPHHLC